MNEQKPIDVEVSTDGQGQQLPAVAQPRAMVNPLDIDAKIFKDSLDRRQANRGVLMDWVRKALVEKVDFGRIHVVGKSKCDKGNACKIPGHWSKPSLFKPGAEKICGMLGVTVTFPTLPDYEQSALSGKTIGTIILRCELKNSDGQVIANGIGCRSVEQDYGDLNKSIKMAEKSAHIDATLRMAGLSEIFTQDIEDMAKLAQDGSEPPRPPRDAPRAPKTPPEPAKAQGEPSKLERFRAKLAKNMAEAGLSQKTMQYFIDLAWMFPTESLENIELKYVPQTEEEYGKLLARIVQYGVTGKAEKPYEPHNAEDTNVPLGTSKQADEPWRSYPMPFGKHAGKLLADLDKKYLYGLWANYEAKAEWEDDKGNVHQTKPEKLAKDKEFRAMLDAAGVHYQFRKDE